MLSGTKVIKDVCFDFETVLEKTSGYDDNPKELYTEEINKHTT